MSTNEGRKCRPAAVWPARTLVQRDLAAGRPRVAAPSKDKAEYLQALFDEMHKLCGTTARYFAEGRGIDAAGQAALRLRFIGAN